MNKALEKRLEECGVKIEDILNNVSADLKTSTVFIYTSHLEGLGTSDSDFDVYVICENLPTLEACMKYEDCIVENVVINNILIDLEYWTINNIYKLVEKLESKKNEQISTLHLKMLNRFKVGEIIANHTLGNEVKNRIANSNINNKIMNSFLIEANSQLEDAVYMYNAKEYHCALSCSFNALEYAIGGLNAKKGFTNLKFKWIPKIFMNNKGYEKDIYEDYLKYQMYPEVNESNLEEFVEEKLEFIQNVISLITI